MDTKRRVGDSEKLIEKKLREGVKMRGGLALKMAPFFFTGLPDRLVLVPGGLICFVELKSGGKKISPRQGVVIAQLEKMGFKTWVIDSLPLLAEFFTWIDTKP